MNNQEYKRICKICKISPEDYIGSINIVNPFSFEAEQLAKLVYKLTLAREALYIENYGYDYRRNEEVYGGLQLRYTIDVKIGEESKSEDRRIYIGKINPIFETEDGFKVYAFIHRAITTFETQSILCFSNEKMTIDFIELYGKDLFMYKYPRLKFKWIE